MAWAIPVVSTLLFADVFEAGIEEVRHVVVIEGIENLAAFLVGAHQT
ncbi:MAG: hypothetical protein Fur0018_11220 [Anaerolineales bacterium]